MADARTVGEGVQALIDRLRAEGVQAGREEAERILSEAREKAESILSEAREEAEELREETREAIAREREAAEESLKMAARDVSLNLLDRINDTFERHVERIVSEELRDPELLRSLILVLAGEVAERHLQDERFKVLLSESVLKGEPSADPELQERSRDIILQISSEMLREGVELIPASDLSDGARVKLEGENLQIDLTSKTLTKAMLKRMLPRFRDILSGRE